MKASSERCLSVLGFSPQDCVCQHQTVGSSVQVVVPSQGDQVGSCVAECPLLQWSTCCAGGGTTCAYPCPPSSPPPPPLLPPSSPPACCSGTLCSGACSVRDWLGGCGQVRVEEERCSKSCGSCPSDQGQPRGVCVYVRACVHVCVCTHACM